MVEAREKTQPIQIREYKPSDYADVKQNLEEGGLFDPVWDGEKNLKEKIERNPGSILVAEVDDKTVGNLYILEDGWGTFIFRMAVRKESRGRGIGTKLLEQAEDRIRQKGIKEVYLFVDEEDEALKDWYIKHGYEPHGRYRGMLKVL